MRLNPKSQSSATRNAKALRAAAADLRHAVSGLEKAAESYAAGEWPEGARMLSDTLNFVSMPLTLLRRFK